MELTLVEKKLIMNTMRKCFFTLVCLFFGIGAFAQDNIYLVNVEGNKIVSKATIISRIKIRAGQLYNENVVNKDIKNLYATGFFEAVVAEKEDSPDGIILIFKVKEKPVLKKIIIQGAQMIRKQKIIDFIDVKEGSFVDEYSLKETVSKIKDMYSKKGLTQTSVTYKFEQLETKNEAQVTFIIDEKRSIKVIGVEIRGNNNISSRRIKRVMKTKKAWLLNRGAFKDDLLNDDVKRLSDFYKMEGFGDIEVNTNVETQDNGVRVIVVINEGKRYHIGRIRIEGNRDVSLDKVTAAMQFKVDDVFSEQVIYEDASRIREVYMDKGYIFSQVDPFSYFNIETQKVDVTYKIVENQVAYVEKIEIKGNARTKDEVVRRELRIFPLDKFDGKKIRISKERLENLGFFEEIRFGTEPGSKPNWIDLVIDVKEAKTGYLSFGGGYSSIDEFIGFVEVRQRNFDYKNLSTFTGGGQDLSITGSFGTVTEQYQVSFTNPWIFDQPLSFGLDGYKKGHKREADVGYAYEDQICGGAMHLGKEFTDDLKGGLTYRYEQVQISDVVSDAAQELKDEAGKNNLSAGETSLTFDTRNNVFAPSKGIYYYNSFQVTGGPFGGTKDFTKYFSQLSLYFPLIRKSVIECKLRAGIASTFDNTDKVPIYQRFFAGGSSTIRGYHERKVGPIDSLTDDPIGGESMFVGNLEYTYPLADFIKLASFFDTGNVWAESNEFLSGGLKSSIGLGLRVKTPIGPVSVDYGWPLSTEPGKDGKEGRFHFSVSRGF
ncbi:MAG: outer membrane protein assembly factor BamA [Candidatus Omnitrophota bacterium]|nr:outer membrane protein assembly factor BamA [Candidatus Omnitrophota bacterium]